MHKAIFARTGECSLVAGLSLFAACSGLAVLALAGCGGGSAALSSETAGCAALFVNAMVYPTNGATNVPDSFTLVLAQNFPGGIRLQPDGGALGAPLPSAPIPSPLPTPHSSLTPGVAFASGALQPKTRYSVVVQSQTCEPAARPAAISSFTTE